MEKMLPASGFSDERISGETYDENVRFHNENVFVPFSEIWYMYIVVFEKIVVWPKYSGKVFRESMLDESHCYQRKRKE